MVAFICESVLWFDDYKRSQSFYKYPTRLRRLQKNSVHLLTQCSFFRWRCKDMILLWKHKVRREWERFEKMLAILVKLRPILLENHVYIYLWKMLTQSKIHSREIRPPPPQNDTYTDTLMRIKKVVAIRWLYSTLNIPKQWCPWL